MSCGRLGWCWGGRGNRPHPGPAGHPSPVRGRGDERWRNCPRRRSPSPSSRETGLGGEGCPWGPDAGRRLRAMPARIGSGGRSGGRYRRCVGPTNPGNLSHADAIEPGQGNVGLGRRRGPDRHLLGIRQGPPALPPGLGLGPRPWRRNRPPRNSTAGCTRATRASRRPGRDRPLTICTERN